MAQTITLDASALPGTIIPGGSTPRIPVPSNGRVVVSSLDAAALVAAGAKYVASRSTSQAVVAAPIAATAGRIVASTALSNGTLSIANQPDVPRQLAVRTDPGTTDTTAGVLTLIYAANDGTNQTDSISLVVPASTTATTTTSKGVVSLTSAIVTAAAGGTSPKIQVNDTNSLSMQVPSGFAGFALERAYMDGAVIGSTAVASSAASFTPSTAPNATHTYSAVFTYTAP